MQAEQGQKQSSLTTIFSIWNTMIGSSLLALPVSLFSRICFGKKEIELWNRIIIMKYDYDEE